MNMLIFTEKGLVKPSDDKSNIVLEFNVPEDIKTLIVKYKYNPKTVENRAEAMSIVNKGLNKYNASFINPESMLPINNLITLSFDENGKYRGACHRQPNNQTIVISNENSTPGIVNKRLEAGKWAVVLNVHYVACRVDYEIEIEGEKES